MDHLTIRVPDEVLERIDDFGDGHPDIDNRSEAGRELIRRGFEFEDIKNERDRLERQYRQVVEQREEHDELVAFAQEQREVERHRDEREQQREQRDQARRQASILKRAKWRVVGEPDDLGEHENGNEDR